MSKVIFLKGLIASGKSTRAKQYIKDNPNTKRVNKDDLREMLDNSVWSVMNEKFVLTIRDKIVKNAIVQGFDIIVDDTNFSPYHEKGLKIIANKQGASFEVKFFDTPLEECILRDSLREKPVGEEVIRDMYEQYLKPKEEAKKFEMDKSKPSCYVFDIDGTLALMKDRGPYEWGKVGQDEVNEPVRDIYNAVAEQKDIIIVSGRDSICRMETEKRLEKNLGYNTRLYMRKEGDMRKDTIIKKEFLDDIIKDYYVKAVFDDRNVCIKMRRDLGLTCLQVADGDF